MSWDGFGQKRVNKALFLALSTRCVQIENEPPKFTLPPIFDQLPAPLVFTIVRREDIRPPGPKVGFVPGGQMVPASHWSFFLAWSEWLGWLQGECLARDQYRMRGECGGCRKTSPCRKIRRSGLGQAAVFAKNTAAVCSLVAYFMGIRFEAAECLRAVWHACCNISN